MTADSSPTTLATTLLYPKHLVPVERPPRQGTVLDVDRTSVLAVYAWPCLEPADPTFSDAAALPPPWLRLAIRAGAVVPVTLPGSDWLHALVHATLPVNDACVWQLCGPDDWITLDEYGRLCVRPRSAHLVATQDEETARPDLAWRFSHFSIPSPYTGPVCGADPRVPAVTAQPAGAAAPDTPKQATETPDDPHIRAGAVLHEDDTLSLRFERFVPSDTDRLGAIAVRVVRNGDAVDGFTVYAPCHPVLPMEKRN